MLASIPFCAYQSICITSDIRFIRSISIRLTFGLAESLYLSGIPLPWGLDPLEPLNCQNSDALALVFHEHLQIVCGVLRMTRFHLNFFVIDVLALITYPLFQTPAPPFFEFTFLHMALMLDPSCL